MTVKHRINMGVKILGTGADDAAALADATAQQIKIVTALCGMSNYKEPVTDDVGAVLPAALDQAQLVIKDYIRSMVIQWRITEKQRLSAPETDAGVTVE